MAKRKHVCTCAELPIGSKVKLTKEYIDEHAKFICGSYIVPSSKEFDIKDLPVIHWWLGHYLKGTQPAGEVVGYGAEEDRSTRRNLKIQLNIPGKETAGYYRHESVVKVKR